MIHVWVESASFLFLVALAILFAVEIAIAENDAGPWGLLWLGIWLVLVLAFTDFNPFPWIIAHPIILTIMIVGYIASGVVYAVFRWWLFVRDPESYYNRTKGEALDPARFKEKITTWMMWWPPSLVWWLLRWPRELFTAIYHALSGVLTRIAAEAMPTLKK